LSTLTPRFVNTIKELIGSISSRKISQLMGLESALDGKEIKKLLSTD
jgi:hypothetical protein